MAGAALTFAELKARAEELVELEGFTNAEHAPDWGRLVNAAYEEYCWETEVYRESATFTTVASQAEYTLTLPYWKYILDLYYNGSPLDRVGLDDLRRMYPNWLVDAAGTPYYWWQPTPLTLRFYPAPATVSITVTLYGIRPPADLSAATDVPKVPNIDHEALAQRAAWKAMERWARGDGRQALQDRVDTYVASLRNRRAEMMATTLAGSQRYIPPVSTERVCP